jgi:hypothetical protein
MFTLLIALGLIVVMLVLGLGSSVLWMRPASRQTDISVRPVNTIESGTMSLSDKDQACAA